MLLFMNYHTLCHNTTAVQDYPESKGIHRIPWSGPTFGLNSVKNVWGASGQRLAARPYPLTKKSPLIRVVKEERVKLPHTHVDRIIQSMVNVWEIALHYMVDIPLLICLSVMR